ncbi:hypothetical protein [Streptomyces sp. NPDC001165]|uniref:hypothetical protein n=1 Tax=Streptomyces sp. NPDC001165 TaxID=3364546 RepID=UPI0036C9CF3E
MPPLQDGRKNGDEQLLRGRVYGHDHDDPNPGSPPHRTYAMLIGGPLDGLLLDITDLATGPTSRKRQAAVIAADGASADGLSDLLPDALEHG